MFTWDSLPRPIIALAPMAGYTDSAYRQLIKEICPQVICFTEFTSTDGLLYGNKATMRQISFDPKKERPIIAQLFGKKPENFCSAAKILTELGVDAIDINMGCPAKKVVSANNGSALLKNPSLAAEIVRATIENTPLPVSVKMRIGIKKYDEDFFLKFVKNIENAGAKLITIHGRTVAQKFTGEADWLPIYKAKKILKIPVIGNGDIKGGRDAADKIKNLNGIMVGRACFGNPWVFKDIAAALKNETYTPPSWPEKIKIIKRHMDLNCKSKGEKYGMLEMRKHLMWYIRGIPHASELRQKLVRVETKKEALALLQTLVTSFFKI